MNLEIIPIELKALPHWVAYRPDKTPVNPKTGGNAKADDPTTWGEFDQAVRYWEAHKGNGIAGVGYEFSFYDPFCGIDLDHCRDPETGKIESWAQEIITRMESYTEVSPSGCGVHILVRGKLPPGPRRKGKVEMYDFGRYFTMTGNHLEGTPTSIEDRQAELTLLHLEIFGSEKQEAPRLPGHSPTILLELADPEILDKARAAKNAPKFERLWGGNWQADYPSQSEADFALCSILAFYTQDPAQIDRLFRQSGLMREKWDRPQSGSTWGALEIQKAIAKTTESYTPGQKPPPPDSPKPQEKRHDPEAHLEAPIIVGFNLTDLGNAQRLVARHGQDLRYCYPWGKWLVWTGQRWAEDASGEVDRRAKETTRNIYAEATATENKNLREALADHARRSESDSKRAAMINSARSELPISPDDLDRDPWLFNVLKGTLDLRAGKLRPHDRQDRIRKLAPVEYDREADCPGWWKFLQRITNQNSELITFLQKAVGYSLTGNTREQCLFFLWGLGANGKTTFLEILKTLLGDYGHQTTSETFMAKRQGGGIPNDLAALKGARFVVAVEVESGRRISEVLVKEMTGGDRVVARFLHQEWFEFKPEFKLWLAANHKPVIRGTDNAIWRRIRLVPFTVQIPEPEQDKDLAEKLKAELPGILNWAVEGCLNWQDYGLASPQEVQEATQEYREEMDVLADFLSECCIMAAGASVPASDLYKAYFQWAEENGERKPLSQTVFGSSLTERGFERKTGTGGKIVRLGIGLKN